VKWKERKRERERKKEKEKEIYMKKQINHKKDYFTVWELYSHHPHLVLFAQLAGGILLLAHWLCCIFLSVSVAEDFDSEWTVPSEIASDAFSSQYLYVYVCFMLCLFVLR